SSYPEQLIECAGRLYFVASDRAHGQELWTSDGTAARTFPVSDFQANFFPNISWLACVGDTLYFSADDGVHGAELWKGDVSSARTVLVKDLRPGASGSDISEPVAVDGLLFFSANDGEHGAELWRSDGTEAGTFLVKDIEPGDGWSYPQRLVD